MYDHSTGQTTSTSMTRMMQIEKMIVNARLCSRQNQIERPPPRHRPGPKPPQRLDARRGRPERGEDADRHQAGAPRRYDLVDRRPITPLTSAGSIFKPIAMNSEPRPSDPARPRAWWRKIRKGNNENRVMKAM